MFCPHCGEAVSEGQLFCQHCGAQLGQEQSQTQNVTEPAPTSSGREKTPWEDREAKGFFGGLFRTMSEALFHPSDFYRRMATTGGLTDPLLFALIVGMTGIMFSYFWQILMRHAMHDMMIPGMQAAVGQQIFQGVALALLAFFTPFLIVVGLFLSSGILHLFLMMVKGAKGGYEATFRVVAYGYSANIFLIIPFCGGLLAVVWAIVLYIIGLKEAHETTGGKAAFAVFFPVIVCCGLIAILAAVIMGVAALSFSSMLQMQK